jgi:hypothetical protein
MHKIVIIGALLSIALPIFADQQEFESGFAAGYMAGYQHRHGQFSGYPMIPICPVAPFAHDTYNEGFIYGERLGENTRY